MLVNFGPRLLNNNPLLIHNLKKFFALSNFKYTPFVQKDLSSKILSGKKDYRMNIWFRMTALSSTIKTQNPL
jgi:hypothetical protein